MSDTYEPAPNSKIGQLITAMRAAAAQRPVWTQTEAAQVMGVSRSAIPPYLVSALSHRLLFRRSTQQGLELSLTPFEAAPTGPHYEKFVPTKTAAPRPGSDVPHPRGTAPKLCTGCSKAECWDNGCQDQAKAAPAAISSDQQEKELGACSISRATELEIKPNDRGHQEGNRGADEEDRQQRDGGRGAEVHAGGAEPGARGGDAAQHAEVEEKPGPSAPAATHSGDVVDAEIEEEAQPKAFIDCASGEIVLVDCPIDDEGRCTIPAGLVMQIRKQIAWMPPR